MTNRPVTAAHCALAAFTSIAVAVGLAALSS